MKSLLVPVVVVFASAMCCAWPSVQAIAEEPVNETSAPSADGASNSKAGGEQLTIDLGEGITMDFILVPAGSFMMGSENGRADERPVHKVTITRPFYLGKYEVTQGQWRAVMGSNPSAFKGEMLPVESVSRRDCLTFLKDLSKKVPDGKFRLPTEAEWEYACRAGTTTAFYFGDDEGELKDYGWYVGNSELVTQPVGRKKPNAWGFFDMHGNVWEWCSDYLGEYEDHAVTDPKGGKDPHFIQMRGGSARYTARNCRSANRGTSGANTRHDFVGLRVVMVIDDE